MSRYYIAPIVEGHGEVEGVPILLRRVLAEIAPDEEVHINPPLRVKLGRFIRDDEYFTNYLELAARKAKGHENGSVLILLDCEDDCPAKVGPRLAEKARLLRSDVTITVALAYREFETWFVAAARSLRGVAGLPSDLEAPAEPEAIRDAKGWLGTRMPSGYNEPNDQPTFTKVFSFDEASSVPSFRRLRRKLTHIFRGSPSC